MKRLVFFFLIFLYPLNVLAFTDTARSTVSIDIDSGRILYEKNAHEKRLIASITKLMTTLVTLENTKDVERKVTVGDEVLKMYGSNIYIEVGEKISIKDLLYGLLLRSGNDASMVLAKNVTTSNTNFVRLMNRTSKRLKMNETIFKNPHGLDEESKNFSTAYDMALLSSYLYKNYKLYRDIENTKKYTVTTKDKTYLWYNRNKLLSTYKYCVGGKTGYTPKAGKTLVSMAVKDNLRITTVTLDDDNEYTTHESIYEKMFSKYKKYKIISKGNLTINKELFKDKLYLKSDFYYPLTLDESLKVQKIIILSKLNNYKNNDKVGYVLIKLNNKVIKKMPIYVKMNVNKKSFFKSLFSR